jgi:hypothetical protein
VVGPTREIRALCYPVSSEMTLVGGEMERWFNLRPGGATRGKGNIIGWVGRGEHQRIFEAPRWYPLPMSVKDHIMWNLVSKH